MLPNPTHYIVDLIESKVTVEDLARAMASLDGKTDEFDAEKGMSARDIVYGHYLGYLCEMEEILKRAAGYAKLRSEVAQR